MGVSSSGSGPNRKQSAPSGYHKNIGNLAVAANRTDCMIYKRKTFHSRSPHLSSRSLSPNYNTRTSSPACSRNRCFACGKEGCRSYKKLKQERFDAFQPANNISLQAFDHMLANDVNGTSHLEFSYDDDQIVNKILSLA